jgi:hypothetical protein
MLRKNKMTSYEHKVKNIYLWSPWGAHIPDRDEYSTVKNIMDWLIIQWGNNRSRYLFIPRAWMRKAYDWTVTEQQSTANLWCTTSWTTIYSVRLNWDNINIASTYDSKNANWFNVRLFLDDYITPDNTRTVEAWTLWSAWIFHNATLWVISLTNGSDKNITMYDKNVWATAVYHDWYTLTANNCGKYFQRWNYYGFPFSWTFNKSSTKPDTSWYWWNNPYSSNVFITVTTSTANRTWNRDLWDDSKEEYFVI